MALTFTQLINVDHQFEVMPLVFPEIIWPMETLTKARDFHYKAGDLVMGDWGTTNYYASSILPAYDKSLDYLQLNVRTTVAGHTRLDYSINFEHIAPEDAGLRDTLPLLYLMTSGFVTYLKPGHQTLKGFGVMNSPGLHIKPEENNTKAWSRLMPALAHPPTDLYYVHFDMEAMRVKLTEYVLYALKNSRYLGCSYDHLLSNPLKLCLPPAKRPRHKDEEFAQRAADIVEAFFSENNPLALNLQGGLPIGNIPTTEGIDVSLDDFGSGNTAPDSSSDIHYFSLILGHAQYRPYPSSSVLAFLDTRQRTVFEARSDGEVMLQGQAIAGHPMISLAKAILLNGKQGASVKAAAKILTQTGRIDLYEGNLWSNQNQKETLASWDVETYPEVFFLRAPLDAASTKRLKEAMPSINPAVDYRAQDSIWIYNPDKLVYVMDGPAWLDVTQDPTEKQLFHISANSSATHLGYIDLLDENKSVIIKRIPVQSFAPVFLGIRFHELHLSTFTPSPLPLPTIVKGNGNVTLSACEQILKKRMGLFAGNVVIYPKQDMSTYVQSIHHRSSVTQNREESWLTEWEKEYAYVDGRYGQNASYSKLYYWGAGLGIPSSTDGQLEQYIAPCYDTSTAINAYWTWDIAEERGVAIKTSAIKDHVFIFMESLPKQKNFPQVLLHEAIHASGFLYGQREVRGYFNHFQETDDDPPSSYYSVAQRRTIAKEEFIAQSLHSMVLGNVMQPNTGPDRLKLTHKQATLLHEALKNL